MKVSVSITNGIINGSTKRFLEKFNLGITFKQRKTYDEFYSKSTRDVNLTLEELSVISFYVDVSIEPEKVILTERD